MSEPLEFALRKDEKWSVYPKDGFNPHTWPYMGQNHIIVIEKSAYDKLKSENAKLREVIAAHIERHCPKSHNQSACTWMHAYDDLKFVLKEDW